MPKKPRPEPVIPDISAETERYEELNPGARIIDEIRSLVKSCLDENGAAHATKEIAEQIECIRIRLNAVIPQIEANKVWMKLLAAANERHAADERHLVRVACTEKEFKASPRTFAKTLQEILSSPQERIAFARSENPDEPLDMSSIVIDPEKINDKLLDNLGLGKYKPSEKYKPRKRFSRPEKLAAYAEAIPAIKEMLCHLEPFTLSHEKQRSRLRYFRLMRIGSGPNEGYLLGTQQIGDKKVLFKTDLHGSHRRIDHIRKGYAGEIDLLIRIVNNIKVIDRKVEKDWPRLRDSGELAGHGQELLEMVEKLQYVENKHKVRIRDLIKGCVTFKTTVRMPEKMGRRDDGTRYVKKEAEIKEVFNPGAMRAQWNTAVEYVGKRVDEIAQIRKYLGEDETRIEKYISSQEAPFDRHYRNVESMHDRFRIFDYKAPLTKRDADAMITSLADMHEECLPVSDDIGHQSVVFEPYLSFAKKMGGHIEKCMKMLSESCKPTGEGLDREAFASEFMKIYLVAKIQYFFHKFEDFYAQHISPERIPYFKVILEEIEGLRTLIQDKRVGREKNTGELIPTPEYNAVFGKIYTLLRDLKARAREGLEAMKGKDKETASKIQVEMRDTVRKFRFEDLMKSDDGKPEKGSGDDGTLDLPFNPQV